MRWLAPFLLLASAAAPRPALAGLGSVALALEGGTASVKPPGEQTYWGLLGGASLGVGLDELDWAQVQVDVKRIPGREPPMDVVALAAGVRHDVDLLPLRPYGELAVGWVMIRTGAGSPTSEVVPVLGLGVDVVSFGWLLWGAVVRYYPLFGSQLEYAPAYFTLNARLGVVLGHGS